MFLNLMLMEFIALVIDKEIPCRYKNSLLLILIFSLDSASSCI